MDNVAAELSRVINSANREVPSMDWSRERQLTHDDNDESIPNSRMVDYYFSDCLGCDSFGDTSLHRVLSMHAPSVAIHNFLFLMQRHRDSLSSGRPFTADAQRYSCLPPPPSIDQQNCAGVTALHMAVYRNSWQVHGIVQLLVEAHRRWSSPGAPNLASIPMACGSYPLHILCGHNRTIHADALKIVLDEDPSVATKEDYNGDNPLSLLWKNVLRFRWAVSVEQGRPNIEYVKGGISWMAIITPEQYVQFSALMISAARQDQGLSSSSQEIPSSPQELSLHDVCATRRCPPLLVRLLLSGEFNDSIGLFGSAHTLDEMGRLPIHHAVQAKVATTSFLSPHVYKTGSPSSLKSVVEILLEAYPESVRVADASGRLPLHYALEAGTVTHKALLALVSLYPDGLRVQDPVSGLYPFMLVASTTARNSRPESSRTPSEAAAEGEETALHWKKDMVRMSYMLLQFCPEAVQFTSPSLFC